MRFGRLIVIPLMLFLESRIDFSNWIYSKVGRLLQVIIFILLVITNVFYAWYMADILGLSLFSESPESSLLVPMRNEANCIEALLERIDSNQEYPENRLEVIIRMVCRQTGHAISLTRSIKIREFTITR